MKKNRLWTLAIVIAAVVSSALIGWIASANIESPAEAAARTAPPSPSPILVPVESRVLSTKIITRGTARFGRAQPLSLVPTRLKQEAGVITTLPDRGQQLTEGAVALTQSGRPVFVLQGSVPVFRNLAIGVRGRDVEQLEEALVRLEFDPGPVDGHYDAETADAVSEWYAAAGWEPFGPTEEQRLALDELEQVLHRATNDRLKAEEGLALATLAADAARARAEAVPEADDEAARLEAELKVQTALSAEKTAGREVALQIMRERMHKVVLQRTLARTGVQLPADEIVFAPSLPVRVEALALQVGDPAVGTVMTVTSNQLSVDASLPLDEAPLVRPGMEVAIDEPDLGLKAKGVVERVAESPGTDGADGYHVYFETHVTETPSSLEGFSLRLTIPVESTGGEVIAVPLSAVSLTADGRSKVQVSRDGGLDTIVVEPGLAAEGFVELSSLEEPLAPGDLVVIGFDSP